MAVIDKTREIQKGVVHILCESCKHRYVCGYTESMNDAIRKLKVTKVAYKGQPFDFIIECRHYTRDDEVIDELEKNPKLGEEEKIPVDRGVV